MMKRSESEILQSFEKINWNFEDYNSSKYPLDLNSIPWYPATFPAPIPKYLVGLLSEPGDKVFDPFGGKGTTVIEAIKQKREFIYNDLNPHAVSIVKCLIDAVSQDGDDAQILDVVTADRVAVNNITITGVHLNYHGKDDELVFEKLPNNIELELSRRNIQKDAVYWFHSDTLVELIRLFDYINSFVGIAHGVRKLAFLSILKEVSSQRGHFSYVTDNCRPYEMKYYSVGDAYIEMLDRIQRACIDFNRQYEVLNKSRDLQHMLQRCIIHEGDAKDCSFIPNTSVDLIITSPPYLCSQDYVLTMRLNNFFYPNEEFVDLSFREIGPRKLRKRPGIVASYFDDMSITIREMNRVLKDGAYFCLVIGQGKGKILDGINVIERIDQSAEAAGFIKLYETARDISYRINRIGGVDKESIILYKKESSIIHHKADTQQ